MGLQGPEPRGTADGHGNFESAGFERALGFYLDTIRSGLAPAWTSTQVANVWDEFDRGRFAFYITGPWQIGEFRRRLPPDRQNIWATAPMPGPDRKSTRLNSSHSCATRMPSSACKQKQTPH